MDATMKLILLGTTGYHPNDRRQTPCLLLPECGVMLDAGTAMYRAGEYLATPELDIFLTHAHLDHVIGLTYLFSVHARASAAADHGPRVAGEAGGGSTSICFPTPCFPRRRRSSSRPLEKSLPRCPTADG